MPRRRVPMAVLLAAALAFPAACGDDDATDAEASDATTTTTEAAEEETTTTATTAAEVEDAPVAQDLQVELLDPGAEPRQELRLAVEVGSEQTFVIHQEQEQTIEAAGTTQAAATTTEQDVTYTVDSVGDELIVAKTTYGEGRVLDDPPVDAATREVLEQVFAAFEGGQGSATFNDRAAILELQVPELGELPPELEGSFAALVEGLEGQASQLATPFPEEAVGVGARWRVSTAFELTGLPVEITTEVTLTALDAGSAEGEITQRVAFVPGPVEVQGVSAEVVSGELAGGGTVRWDLSTPVTSVDQEASGTIVIRVQQGGTQQDITQTIRQRSLISPA